MALDAYHRNDIHKEVIFIDSILLSGLKKIRKSLNPWTRIHMHSHLREIMNHESFLNHYVCYNVEIGNGLEIVLGRGLEILKIGIED